MEARCAETRVYFLVLNELHGTNGAAFLHICIDSVDAMEVLGLGVAVVIGGSYVHCQRT